MTFAKVCDKVYYSALAAGAITAATGPLKAAVPRVAPPLARVATPDVHYFLAGVAVKALCGESLMLSWKDTLMAGGLGLLGGRAKDTFAPTTMIM
jgi:hypothetical protein